MVLLSVLLLLLLLLLLLNKAVQFRLPSSSHCVLWQ
jgi:hypothetical protein